MTISLLAEDHLEGLAALGLDDVNLTRHDAALLLAVEAIYLCCAVEDFAEVIALNLVDCSRSDVCVESETYDLGRSA